MKNEKRFLERMNEIDDELIIRADESTVVNNKKKFHKRIVIIVAAILAVCAVSATATALHFKNSHGDCDCKGDVINVPISDVFWIDKREKNNNKAKWNLGELGVVIPWNELEHYEKYTEMSINGDKYYSRASHYGEEIFANQIGKMLYESECFGYDAYGDKSYSIACSAYEIIGVDPQRFVAVKYDGYNGYYPFIKDKNQATATLGELIDALSLNTNVKLNDFYYENEHCALSNENSDTLWNIIKEYSSAPIASESLYHSSNSEVSFAMYSNSLGAYNLSFSFTADGYLKTNIEGYGYVYDIGAEGVERIIEFVRKNRLAILVPQTQYLVGIITEIGDDYIKVDDSIMMLNPDEGIEFTVYSNARNKLRAYIKMGIFKLGDAVIVEHSYLAKENYTVINNAAKVQDCSITTGGEVIIPE